MPLSQEVRDFYQRWLQKADAYEQNGHESDYFDRFSSLFVVFNRLYGVATFALARNKQIDLSKRSSFPDGKAAKEYVLQYLKSGHYIERLEAETPVREAIETIMHLIANKQFYIKLDMVTGDKQPDKDENLLMRLSSRGKGQRAEAILDLLYSIRCNMFHGQKGFQEVQLRLLGLHVRYLRQP